MFGGGKPELALANPIAADLSDMRPSLIPGLVAAAQKNADRGLTDAALFEVGQIFKGDKPRSSSLPRPACAARSPRLQARAGIGHQGCRGRLLRRQGRRLRGARRRGRADAGAAGGAGRAGVVPSRPLGHDPDRAAERARPFRRAASAHLEALDAEGPLVGFEVILERIPEPKAKATRAKPALELSPFQPVERDFAFVVDRDVKAGDLVRAAQNVDRKLITA